MFYQKYRPQKFSQVFGNENIVSSLQTSLQKQNLGHAFLFYGPRGVGKTTMARLLAKALICKNYNQENGACLTCEDCKDVLNGTYPDLIELDAASNNSVENIRYINERVHLAPTRGDIKFYIIDEVHMLSKGAFNALLKTLEEPPKNTYFVLATTEIEKVIDTIKSRCQQFEFKRASTNDVVNKLDYIAKQESFDISKEDLQKIAAASKGGFRDAETMLESVIVGGEKVDEVLNSVGVDFSVRFFDSVLDANSSLSIELINNVYSSGKNLEAWNKELLAYLRSIMLIKEGLQDLVEYNSNDLELVKNQAQNFTKLTLLKALKAFNNSLEGLKYSYIPTLPLEIAVLEINQGIQKNVTDQAPLNSNPSAPTDSTTQENTQTSAGGTGDVVAPSQTEKAEASKVEQAASVAITQKVEVIKKVKPKPKIKKSKKTVAVVGDIDDTKFNWGSYIEAVKQSKPSVATILKNCKYSGVEGDSIIIEARFKFHKERLEIPSTFSVLVEVAKQILGTSCGVVCKVKQKNKQELTDKNVNYVTVSENEIPKFESSKPRQDKNGEYQIPLDDENFVASPVTVKEQAKEQGVNPHDAFGGEFEI